MQSKLYLCKLTCFPIPILILFLLLVILLFRDIYAQRGGSLTEKQICAGGEPGRDSCVGDSGSGLMRILGIDGGFPQSYLIGVVSFGPRRCGTKGVPGVYTRVNSYLDWILDTVMKVE